MNTKTFLAGISARAEELASTSPLDTPLRYRSSHLAMYRINQLEVQLGITPSRKPPQVREANARVAYLEQLLSAKAPPAPTEQVPPAVIGEPPQRIAAGLVGRDRFLASYARAAAGKPKAKNHPEISGRERFVAGVQVDGSTPQVLLANPIPAPAGAAEKTKKTGRERFISAVVIKQ